MALVSPIKGRIRSPVADLHACWIDCNEKEKEAFDFEPWKNDIEDFLTLMMNSGGRHDLQHSGQVTKCLCMEKIRETITEQEKEGVLQYLVMYARL